MLTFLVVDDDVHLAIDLGDILELEYGNCRVLTAFDGQAGLALALKHEPNLIVCNYMMPKMNGLEVLWHLRLYPWMHSVPFLLTSAARLHSMGRLDLGFGRDAGTHFLSCPIDPWEFVEKVAYLLAERDAKAIVQQVDKPFKLYPIEEGGQRLFTSK